MVKELRVKLLFLIALNLGLAMTFHLALAATIQCPHEIKTNQSLQEKINGWGEFLDDGYHLYNLKNITFYADHPKRHVSLAPDNESTSGNTLIWTFGNDKIWLACGYSNTTLQLIKMLSDKTKRCTVTYGSNFTKVISINCI